MKKLAILASGLALTACGGGGGGSHSGSSASVYVPPRPAVTSAIATSNAQITNMPSEVVVASNSSDPVSVVGSVSTEIGGVTYTSYRLDDVKLLTAENLDTVGHSYVNLELNETTGEIDAVKMVVGGVESGRNARDTVDTTTFQGPIFEYVSDGDDKALFRVVDNGQDMATLIALESPNDLTGGHWNRVDERMVFGTHGKDIGLQYADFGYFNPIYRTKNFNLTSDAEIDAARAGTLDRGSSLDKKHTDEEFAELLTTQDYQLFAGGYAISGTTMVDTLNPGASTSYTGKALGRVYVSIQSDGVDRTPYLAAWDVPGGQDGHDMAKAYTTSSATMVIGADGTQTLSMPFNTASDTADTFYDVTITKAPEADPTFTFTGTPSELQYRRNDTESNIESDFTPGYYGVNTPVEAAGTARYYAEQAIGTGSDDVTREWEFQAAYGMKKD
ncbi:hypothetical protein [Candidatus Avelusimicrobium caledoniensis]|uniref:hypothetical protein n=1 Tax=Candidatus Avelusimicrobium caledoniensis TaxID=3416220 RepID=UPI003D0BED00